MLGDFGVGIVNGGLDGTRQLLIARALERAVATRGVRLVITHRRQRLPGPPGHRRHRQRGRRLVLELLPALPLRAQSGPVLPDGRQPRRGRQRELGRSRPTGGQPLSRRTASVRRSKPGPRRSGRDCSTASRSARTSSSSVSTPRSPPAWTSSTTSTTRSTAAGSRRSLTVLALAGGSRSHTTRRSAPGLSTPTRPAWLSASSRYSSARGSRSCSAGTNTTSSTPSSTTSTTWSAAPRESSGPSRRRDFEPAGTVAWAAAGHFLLARAEKERLVVEALDGSLEPIEPVDPRGRAAEPVMEIRWRGAARGC